MAADIICDYFAEKVLWWSASVKAKTPHPLEWFWFEYRKALEAGMSSIHRKHSTCTTFKAYEAYSDTGKKGRTTAYPVKSC